LEPRAQAPNRDAAVQARHKPDARIGKWRSDLAQTLRRHARVTVGYHEVRVGSRLNHRNERADFRVRVDGRSGYYNLRRNVRVLAPKRFDDGQGGVVGTSGAEHELE